MLRIALCLGFLAASAVGLSPRAEAQTGPRCLKRADVMERLAANFREAPVAMGIADGGNLLEVFAANDGATWTVVLTLPNGMSCLLMSGESWETVPLKAAAGSPI